ncbi:MAG: GntR family transcriptional regulator [Chloroflexi bacterium]|nr:GntR family transcriptional regulator [Anaerolineaceae bacterium]NMB90769.1 GntR family transcriptional regulator [Chloroflexota bacterium]
MIDFSSYVPYYVQLRDQLKARIEDKVWKNGDKLPGEVELCREFGVSRTVVRQALLELELAGYILRRKGRGTFVAGPKISEGLVQKLTGFYQDMIEQGRQPSTRVLVQRLAPASDVLATALQVEPGTMLVEIRRLRFVDGEPITLVTSYVPQALCPQLDQVDLNDRSLYDYLENHCRLVIARAHRSIEAMLLDEADAALLQARPGDAAIRLESIAFLEDGRPVEYYLAYHRGDRARFEIDLVRRREQWRALNWDPGSETAPGP